MKTISQRALDREYNQIGTTTANGETLNIYLNKKTPSMDPYHALVTKEAPDAETGRFIKVFSMTLFDDLDFSDDIRQIANDQNNVLELFQMEYRDKSFQNSNIPLDVYNAIEKKYDIYIDKSIETDSNDPVQEKIVQHLIEKTKKKLEQLSANNDLLERILSLSGVKKLNEMPRRISQQGQHVPRLERAETVDIDAIPKKRLIMTDDDEKIEFYLFRHPETQQRVVYGVMRPNNLLVFKLSFYRTPRLPQIANGLSRIPNFIQVQSVVTVPSKRDSDYSARVYQTLAKLGFIIASDTEQTPGGEAVWNSIFNHLPEMISSVSGNADSMNIYLLTNKGVVGSRNYRNKDVRGSTPKYPTGKTLPTNLIYHPDRELAETNLYLLGYRSVMNDALIRAKVPTITDKQFRLNQLPLDTEWQENRKQQIAQMATRYLSSVKPEVLASPSRIRNSAFGRGRWPEVLAYLRDNVKNGNYKQAFLDLVDDSYDNPEMRHFNIFYDVDSYPVTNLRLAEVDIQER